MDNKIEGKVTQSERQQITTSKCSLQTIDVNIVQSVMHINLHYLRLIFPEAQALIKVFVTQFHSEAAVLAWA